MSGALRVPSWRGPFAWSAEIYRQLDVLRCSTPRYTRFKATCVLLTTWRIRSPVQCSADGVRQLLPILECAHVNHGRLPLRTIYSPCTGWTSEELGTLLVEARNRMALAALGRDRARTRGPRFHPSLMPADRLASLIQSHPDMAVVEVLRAELRRREAATAAQGFSR